ncbi:MAG: hypothetical protein GEV28_32035 [Actinophytocola sp.]|uniref:hypothetical protein n=1 Tax=Actinophytocola sp. TaxID=1872138 RepID=UPI001323B669|nr:hypothetical protein [Actinophytocola sp.]MPZ84766.1 hypothetical protein [Actinophytocola sp.]
MITKQAARPESPVVVKVPVEAPPATPVEATVEALPAPVSHRRPPSRGAQLAKLTSLGVATVVLCGAVGVASTIAHQRRESADTTDRAAERISGEQGLLPGELNRTLPGNGIAEAAPPPKPAPVTEPTRSADTRAVDTGRAQQPARTGAEPRTAGPAVPKKPAAEVPTSDLDLVRAFYKLLPSDPREAFHLISPDLLHSTLGQFLDSWSTVRSVQVVDLRHQGDNVLATVRMRLADGGHLQLQQLLTVADSPRRIVGAQLLSAQRN